MNLESICTSLEMSKKLQEVGFKEETCFGWITIEHYQGEQEPAFETVLDYLSDSKKYVDLIPAYTFEQIYKVLPEEISEIFKDSDGKEYEVSQLGKLIYRFDGLWLVGYYGYREDDINYSDNLADATAKCFIWCVENNFLTLKK